jgi:hypothetical protein
MEVGRRATNRRIAERYILERSCWYGSRAMSAEELRYGLLERRRSTYIDESPVPGALAACGLD